LTINVDDDCYLQKCIVCSELDIYVFIIGEAN